MKDYDLDIKQESDFLNSCFKLLGAVEFSKIEYNDLVIFVDGLSRHMDKLISLIDRSPVKRKK